jgi:hypothetical protein
MKKLIYKNDLPNTIADLSKPILLADDTSIVIANPSPSEFKEDINNIIDNVNDWFRCNSLSSCSWFRASSFIKLNKNQLDAPLF